jgi:proteasome accessory factor C
MPEQQTTLRVLRLMRMLRKRRMDADQMLNFLESDGVTTKRTIHRYIELLKELNLNVQKDAQNRYWIEDKNNERDFALDDLLPEEATFLKNLIQQHAPDSVFTEGVLAKIRESSDLTAITDSMVRQQTEVNITQLKQAINQKVCVILKRYYTLDKGIVADRRVEPKELHKGGRQVYAHDLKDGKMKKYSTDRIESVQLLPDPQTHDTEFEHSDVFGFSHTDARAVKLRLSMKAYYLLREEYPRSEKHLKEEGDKWLFEHIYCKPEGIGRFLLSVGASEVEILQPNDLKSYLNERQKPF